MYYSVYSVHIYSMYNNFLQAPFSITLQNDQKICASTLLPHLCKMVIAWPRLPALPFYFALCTQQWALFLSVVWYQVNRGEELVILACALSWQLSFCDVLYQQGLMCFAWAGCSFTTYQRYNIYHSLWLSYFCSMYHLLTTVI